MIEILCICHGFDSMDEANGYPARLRLKTLRGSVMMRNNHQLHLFLQLMHSFEITFCLFILHIAPSLFISRKRSVTGF